MSSESGQKQQYLTLTKADPWVRETGAMTMANQDMTPKTLGTPQQSDDSPVIGHLDKSFFNCGPGGHAVECGRQENLVTENEIKIKHLMNPVWG